MIKRKKLIGRTFVINIKYFRKDNFIVLQLLYYKVGIFCVPRKKDFDFECQKSRYLINVRNKR